MNPLHTPSVAILLATYNGAAYLAEQISSIAAQKAVAVTLIISDDSSNDGTPALVATLCRQHGLAYVLLPATLRMGSAGRNFFRLIRDADTDGFDYFAFADQDDIWDDDKLIRSIGAMRKGADAVSSDVTAFWPDGTKQPVIKHWPQRSLDYLFESPGPGCTFVLAAPLFQCLQDLVQRNEPYFLRCELHDWAVYAVARSLGYSWEIMQESTMLYRQHASNSFGAHKGLSALTKRLRMIRGGWMREQVLATAELVERCCGETTPLVNKYRKMIQAPSLGNRIALFLGAPRMRRRRLDALVLAGLFLSGLFWSKTSTDQSRR